MLTMPADSTTSKRDCVLRPIAHGDITAVRTLHAAAFRALGGSHNTPDEIEAHVAEIMAPGYAEALMDNHVAVAVDAGGAVLATAGWCTVAGRPGVARIRKVFVRPDRAGTGLGRRMVEAAEAEARRQGMTAFTVRANANAVAFYERLGYRTMKRGRMSTVAGVDLPVAFMDKTGSGT